jgi:GMP synthase-like glutamine amidotransferase
MTIGLLECDHVMEKFRSVAGDYSDMFSALFAGHEIVPFDVVNGRLPGHADDCDAYLTTGSKFSVYDDVPWIRDLQAFVRDLYAREKVYVGVCFGHQMLGQALGGRVEKAPVGWCVGRHTFSILKREPWMEPFQEKYSLHMMCQDQIVELPPDSTVLAATADCPVGMIRVGERMLGLQAHPEFPMAYEKALMEDRVERIGAEKVRAGLASLGPGLDAVLVAGWITRFIKTNRKDR